MVASGLSKNDRGTHSFLLEPLDEIHLIRWRVGTTLPKNSFRSDQSDKPFFYFALKRCRMCFSFPYVSHSQISDFSTNAFTAALTHILYNGCRTKRVNFIICVYIICIEHSFNLKGLYKMDKIHRKREIESIATRFCCIGYFITS